MDRFKAKVWKMGKKKVVGIPASVRDYFEVGDEVEIIKNGGKKK